MSLWPLCANFELLHYQRCSFSRCLLRESAHLPKSRCRYRTEMPSAFPLMYCLQFCWNDRRVFSVRMRIRRRGHFLLLDLKTLDKPSGKTFCHSYLSCCSRYLLLLYPICCCCARCLLAKYSLDKYQGVLFLISINKTGSVNRILPSGRACRFVHEPHLSILTFLHFQSFIIRYSGLNYPVKAFKKKISHIEKCNLFSRNIHYSALSFYIPIT